MNSSQPMSSSSNTESMSSSDGRKNPPPPSSSSSSSEDSGSGSDGGADEGNSSSSSSSSHLLVANRVSQDDGQKQQQQQEQQEGEDDTAFDQANSISDQQQQQHSTSLSAAGSVVTAANRQPDDVVVTTLVYNYKDYSHEFPTTENELYLQQPGVVTTCSGKDDDELGTWATTTTATTNSASRLLFPLQLHEILSEMEQQQRNDNAAAGGGPLTAEDKNIIIVAWQPHGRSFKIHDAEKLVETILPKYFATTSEAWFLEQLNDHGFHRFVGVGPDQGSYYHEKFLRGMKFLSPQIMPQSVKAGGIKTVVDLGDEPVLKRYPICPPIPLQRMLRAKGFAVSVYSNSSPTLRQASSFLASQSDMALTKPLKIMTPLDATTYKLINDGQACFPLKLHRILHHLTENGNDEIMSWLPHGRAFAIHDQDRFVSELMPVYFMRQNKYKSFSRQLHNYNFKIVQEGPDKGAFRHEFFLRDEPKLCLQMHRTKKARDLTISEESEFTNPPSPASPRTTSGPAVVTPTKTDTAAVELMALQCMMREQGQGCAALSSSKHSMKTSTSAKTKNRKKPKKAAVAAESLDDMITTTTPMSRTSPDSIDFIMPMTQLLPTIIPESLESILSTTKVRAAQNSWPLRLQRILDKHEAEGDGQIFSWLPHGRAFAIHQPDKFLSHVMPLYFRNQTKFNSFTRNLYEYSFKRLSTGPYKNVFYHAHFLRGQPHEALKITRIRRYKDRKSVVPDIPPAEPDFFARLALPCIAAGATIDVPADPLADAKHSAKRTKITITSTASVVDGTTLDDFDIFDEDDPELGLWSEVFDPANDVDV